MNGKKNVENVDSNFDNQLIGADQASATGSLDERLQTPAQMALRQVVKALPEDMPSLAWRSVLNERLVAATAARRARQRRWLFGGSSFAGLALAAGLAFVVFLPKHPVEPAANPNSGNVVRNSNNPVTAPSLEDQLLASHNDSVTSQDVVGAGLTSQEVQSSDDDSEGQPTS